MTRVDILSGLGRKASAAIRVHHRGRTLLLDAGGPLHPAEPCDWVDATGPLDAILISHDHPDHIGSVARLPWTIPLYCTPEIALALPPGRAWRALPRQGRCEVLGIEVTTGRAGHSHGGVWLHLGIGDGLFYSGDASLESRLFPFDPPPRAGTALLDASYGLYDRHQSDCEVAILRQLEHPTVLPTPLSGRAIELALWLASLEHRLGLDWTIDRHCRAVLRDWSGCDPDAFQPGVTIRLRQLAARDWPDRARVMLVADRDDSHRDWPGYRLLHTGYLTPARRDRVAAGLEYWQRWNVHLRASDLAWLRDALGAGKLVPLFTRFDPNAPWYETLGPALSIETRLELDHDTDTTPLRIPAPR